jgi:hypothetical protein
MKKNEVQLSGTEKQPTFEMMAVPEISIEEEPGHQLLSLLLKAENPQWGENNTPLAKETIEYFQQVPLNSDIIETFRELKNSGVDEEAMYYYSLTYQRPERTSKVLEVIDKYKPHIKNAQEIHKKILICLKYIDSYFSNSPLIEKFTNEIGQDKEKRIGNLEETEKMTTEIISFFKPDSQTTNIKKLIFVPTDPLENKFSGNAIPYFPEECLIFSNIENTLNQKHEFSHSIINPIIEKLEEKLTTEQKKKISKLASITLKENYGEGSFSLLCEEFINAYTKFVSAEKKPVTYEAFNNYILSLDEKQFQEIIIIEPRFKERLANLNIKSLKELKDKSQEYFNTYNKNDLIEVIFDFYQNYINRQDKNTNFEQFVLENFPTFLEEKIK